MSSVPLLAAESLNIQRGQGAKHILKGNTQCCLQIQAGHLYHLTGPSGSGKSTLLWALARLHPLTGGRLYFQGQAADHIHVACWRAEIALLPQVAVMVSGSVRDNLLYPLTYFHIQKQRLQQRGERLPTDETLQQALATVGLEEIDLNHEAVTLSGGQQARLALIRLLLTQPQLILADEPTHGVDEQAVQLIFQRLSQFCCQGGAVIVTSHVYHQYIQGQRIVLKSDHELALEG